ncbi:fructose-1-phosphate kinase [Hypnocyclicus thermotrophus]|uniref:1-phosphofructokinase n=1 Tax=Hypnocyclicus thermotrophus TaxID=1627895 RepID=A0AA46DXG9_9FUSO|nr:1-phosphofructokinase [Hypnocyclicus thermotrophus]TDT68037.1 fructose-1-phosphate kinase [Hypnocyclicus thermotrophus]
MIYTLTLNPSLDYTVIVDEFKENRLNLSKEEYKTAGGKGINVSQVLQNLNVKSIAMGYLAGFTGEFIEKKLKENGILTDFIKLDNGDTRINIKMKSKNSETEINGNSPYISIEKVEKLIKKIKEISKEDIVILAGSVPKSLPSDTYIKIIKSLNKNTKFILDTRTKILKNTSKYKPFLVKPNKDELEEIFNIKLESLEEVIKYGKQLKDIGPQNVIVSLGEKGAIFITKNGIYKAIPPKGELIDSVGAGDSMIAGFTAKYIETSDLLESFKYAVATGTATAYSRGLATKKLTEKLYKEIEIEKI